MMKQKLSHDYAPMEAKTVAKLPSGSKWQYEPKWDGFRCIAFKENGEVDLRSKSGQPLGRYFPEVVKRLEKLDADQFILDGELVVLQGKVLSFDDLLQRIHPAKSRVEKLARETPASYIIFDILLTEEGRLLTDETVVERRKELEKFATAHIKPGQDMTLSPVTNDLEVAEEWLVQRGTFLDGIIAKRTDMPYQSGNKNGMVKVKKIRTADCVIGGFRYGTNSKVIGSLLLGLYDDKGDLHHVGFTSAFTAKEKEKLTEQLEPLRTTESFTASVPGGPSRWSNERSTEWVPLKPELVVEVSYDHFTNERFRHGTKIVRWRPDKAPKQCTFEQIK